MARYLTDLMLSATEDFDRVRLTDPNGNIQARIVFTTVLFFEGGGTRDGQARAIETMADLADGMADQLSLMQTADPSARTRRFDARQFREESLAAIDQGHRNGAFELNAAFFGEPVSAPSNKGVAAFGGSVTASAPFTENHADLAHLEVSTSLMWDAPNDFRNQVARVLQAARTLRPRHGLAGFGIQFDRIHESATSHAVSFPFLKRFPGLHCGRNRTFKVRSTRQRKTTDRIFTTNWLTVLADDIVDQLGGASALGQALGDNGEVHGYEGGVVLQAGPYPQPGDVNNGIIPKAYREVARATAPVRFEDYKLGILVVPPQLDSLAETLAWVRRFD